MKKGWMICCLLLSSCSFPSTESIPRLTPHDYNELQERQLQASTLFFSGTYQVYFYSLECSVCLSMKNEVVEFGLHHEDFFLYLIDDKMKYRYDTTCVGATSFEEIFLPGTPSLFQIKQGRVEEVLIGKREILSWMENREKK